jgi:hypothetical protein
MKKLFGPEHRQAGSRYAGYREAGVISGDRGHGNSWRRSLRKNKNEFLVRARKGEEAVNFYKILLD